MKVRYFTNTGKYRKTNQDGVLLKNRIVLESMEHSEAFTCKDGIFCISDGMGGKKQGEIATKIWLEILKNSKIKTIDEMDEIITKTQQKLQGYDTGCATAGVVFAAESFIFNVGDCRVYKKESDFLNKLTHDHSIVQQLIDNGEIDEEKALSHPKNHILTSAITPQTDIEVYKKPLKIFDEDLFFLCSDGIWGEFGIEELEECFISDDIDMIDDLLQETLKTKEQKDNFSYILLKV